MRTGRWPYILLAVFIVFPIIRGLGQQSSGSDLRYNSAGKMLLPANYREWNYVSSGLGMTYGTATTAPANPSFDNVFVNPAAYQAFQRTGTWPDKTVLILEVRASDSKASINKGGFYQTAVRSIEAHVKDESRGGWAFYGFGENGTEAEMLPKTRSCYSCHEQNGAVDTTFVQFYPALRTTAAAKGTFREGKE